MKHHVNGIPVVKKHINLKYDCDMVSEYDGRGIPAKSKTFPAGTQAFYETIPLNGKFCAHAGEPITHWKHIVRVTEGRTTYTASKTIYTNETTENNS